MGSARRAGAICFSPLADAATGAVVGAIGIDALRHVRDRRELLLASLPVVFGAHQFTEAFVWWGLQGRVEPAVGRAGVWLYLFVAFALLPVLVPASVKSVEPDLRKRQAMTVFLALGSLVAVSLTAGLLTGPVGARLAPFHIQYTVHLVYGIPLTGLYLLATSAPLIMSSHRHLSAFGAVNFVAAMVLAWLTAAGVVSLWCALAAVASLIIAFHLRLADRPETALSASA